MTVFRNGHTFTLALRCQPPRGHFPPAVAVEMAGASTEFVPVIGKVDTGAFRTMLSFETAERLGIHDPTSSARRTATAHTATGEPFRYWVHVVSIRIAGGAEGAIEFPLMAAFADQVERNLFGVDWLEHLCLAVDRQAVHFLKD